MRPADNLSFCAIVKNEERALPRCLESVRGLAGELIIVDTGSTDATRRTAADFGAQVMNYDFAVPDFAAARNHGLDQASGDWIVVLDADETLEPGSAQLIQELIARHENAGYYLQRLNQQDRKASC